MSEGIESRLLDIISSKLNFTWEIKYPDSGTYGNIQSDGSEDGIIGEASKNFDI